MRNFTLKSSFTTIRSVRYTLLFLLFFTSNAVFAQHFHSTSPYLQGTQVQAEQYQGPEVGYHSTIYTPFSDETPSGNNAPAGITGRKNTINTGGFGTETDPNASKESPIGEPWIMLAFAVMAAVVITLRKKQTA